MSKGTLAPGQLRIWCDDAHVAADRRMFMVVRRSQTTQGYYSDDDALWLVVPVVVKCDGGTDMFLGEWLLKYSKEVA